MNSALTPVSAALPATAPPRIRTERAGTARTTIQHAGPRHPRPGHPCGPPQPAPGRPDPQQSHRERPYETLGSTHGAGSRATHPPPALPCRPQPWPQCSHRAGFRPHDAAYPRPRRRPWNHPERQGPHANGTVGRRRAERVPDHSPHDTHPGCARACGPGTRTALVRGSHTSVVRPAQARRLTVRQQQAQGLGREASFRLDVGHGTVSYSGQQSQDARPPGLRSDLPERGVGQLEPPRRRRMVAAEDPDAAEVRLDPGVQEAVS